MAKLIVIFLNIAKAPRKWKTETDEVCMTSWHGATDAWFTKNESSECRIVCNQTKRNGTKQNAAYKGQSVVSVAIVWPSWHIETCPSKF
jgi:hypothetical protein